MENGIRVGNEISKESRENLGALIREVFTVGFETRMEQETVRKALEVIERVTEVRNITITHSVIRGDNHIHMDDSSPTDSISEVE